MFRCAVTGQVSEGAVWGMKDFIHEVTGEEYRALTIIKPAEKPLKLTVQSRPKEYLNILEDEEGERIEVESSGSEIVKEITIRECNLELAKKKYNLL